jgi:hypothetical protein
MRRRSAFVLALCWAGACSNPEQRRLEQTTKATYDTKTGRLTELTYDANKNGRIDTWTEMDGARPIRSRLDRNEDGRIDRWEYYDGEGKLLKVGMSRSDDGKVDSWAFAGPDGRIARVEISSARDEAKIDRWERYAPSPKADAAGILASVDEDTNGDGKPDKWETYAEGALKTVAFDQDHDGKPDRRLSYEAGVLSLIETEPDASGTYRTQVPVK